MAARGREWKRIKVICDVMFENSLKEFNISSVICLLLRVFIVHVLARMELDFGNVHNQIQPYLFEPLASGHDSSNF